MSLQLKEIYSQISMIYYNIKYLCFWWELWFTSIRSKFWRLPPAFNEFVILKNTFFLFWYSEIFVHTCLWYLKRFYEGPRGLHKAFWGTTKKCEKMLLWSELDVETDGEIEVFDTRFSARRNSIRISLVFQIPASVILLVYFWFLKTVCNSLDLAVLILAFSTMIFIFWGKSKGYVFLARFRVIWIKCNILFQICWFWANILLPCLFIRTSRNSKLLLLISMIKCMPRSKELKILEDPYILDWEEFRNDLKISSSSP